MDQAIEKANRGSLRATLLSACAVLARTALLPALALLPLVGSAGSASTASAQVFEIEEAQQAARQNARDPEAQLRYGRVLVRAGRFRQARTQMQRYARLERNDARALFEVARATFASGDQRASQAACRAVARAAGSDSAMAHACNARAWIVWGRSARALSEIEAVPEAARAGEIELQYALGEAQRRRANLAEAEAAYNRANAIEERAETFLGLGRLYRNANRREDAERALRRALALDATDPEILYELGALLGSGPEARRLLDAAVGSREDFTLARVALADLHLASGEHQEAEPLYRAAIASNRRDPNPAALRGLGQVLIATDRLEEAEQVLGQSLEIIRNDSVTNMALGDVYARTQREPEAYQSYTFAADLNRADPRPLLRATELALRQHRHTLASGYLDQILERFPNNAPAHAFYGDVARARHNNAQAREHYQAALRGQGEIDRAHVQQALRELGGR